MILQELIDLKLHFSCVHFCLTSCPEVDTQVALDSWSLRRLTKCHFMNKLDKINIIKDCYFIRPERCGGEESLRKAGNWL